MNKFFAVSFLVVTLSASAAENSQSHEVGKVDVAKSAKELADMVVSWSAGYCKVQADKQGADFNTCFTRVTNMAIEKLQNVQAMQQVSR